MAQQQFCLRWNNHQKNMIEVFGNLLASESFVDVTLACDGMLLKAHRMVLSSCSTFFQDIFMNNPCKHPVIIMKDIKYNELKAILEFVYKGEVNVSQDQLSAILRTAETLKVKGLAEVSEQQEQNKTPPSEQTFPPPPSSESSKNRTSHPNRREFPSSKSNFVRPNPSSPQSPNRKRTRFERVGQNMIQPPNRVSEVENRIHTTEEYVDQNPEFVEAPIPSDTHDMTDGLSDHIEINEDIKPIQIKQSPHSPEIEEIKQNEDFNLYSSFMDQTGHSSHDLMDNNMPSGSKDILNESNDATNDSEFNSNMDPSMSMPSTSGPDLAIAYSYRSYKLWSEEMMDLAVDDVTQGLRTVRGASRVYNVPFSTLLRYSQRAQDFR